MVRPNTVAILISIFVALFAVYPSAGFAQSKLPPCPSDQTQRWDNCFGTFTWSDGENYVGEWKDGERNGQGTGKKPDGKKYVGEWKDNKPDGHGTLTYGKGEWEGDQYVGEWRENKQNGQGTYKFSNGTKYVGNWKDNRFSGNGTLYAADGSNLKSGIWENGELVQAEPDEQVAVFVQPAAPVEPSADDQQAQFVADLQTALDEYQAALNQAAGGDFAGGKSAAETALARILGLCMTGGYPDVPSCIGQELPPMPEAPVEQPTALASDGSKIALVIGNSDYENAPSLKTPKNDAVAMTAMLEGLGFTVVSGTDLGKRELEKKVRDFVQGTKNAEIALFFYAGHGIQVAGKNYMLPIDAALKDESAVDFELVDLDIVSSYMGGVDKVGIVLLDACRDNPFTVQLATALGSGRSAQVGRCLGRISAKKGGVLFGFATAPDIVAPDGIGQNSPFTTALLKQLPTRGLEIQQVMTRVKADVIEATNNEQRPWTESDFAHEVFLVQ